MDVKRTETFEERTKRRLAEMKRAIEGQTPVIGLDFGNCNSFLCYIPHSDMRKGRLGGAVQPLLPAQWQYGIPSVFFYANNEKCKRFAEKNENPLPWCGIDAVNRNASPYKNRVKLLKRHLGKNFTLDDRTFSYDDAIVKVVEHCVRAANAELKKKALITTNLVSLSYPATYFCSQRERLIELVERATLEDGTHLKVFGTISEPAAAALSYLAEEVHEDMDTTVLTYDLGGGTFDLALVSAYPKGKKNPAGETYYYDIVNACGIENLGGADFDMAIYQLLMKKIGKPLSEDKQDKVLSLSESIKIELSSYETAEAELDGVIDDEIEITRKEFEAAIMPRVMETIAATKALLKKHPNQQPELIVLTGGASQMPIIKETLEKELPQYKGKVVTFQPSEAISYGAARFGTVELKTDPDTKDSSRVVQQRLLYDIGTNCMDNSNREYVSLLIPAGTPIPYKGNPKQYNMHADQRTVLYDIYEACKSTPDVYKMATDYKLIMSVELDYEKVYPKGTPSECTVSVDALGQLFIEARDLTKPNKPPVKKDVKLTHLS